MAEFDENDGKVSWVSQESGRWFIIIGIAMVGASILYISMGLDGTKPEGEKVKSDSESQVQAERTEEGSAGSSPDSASQAVTLFWATVLILGATLAMVVGIILSRRMSARFRGQLKWKRSKTPYYDPWKESSQRVSGSDLEEDGE